jgi:hypothetical protein
MHRKYAVLPQRSKVTLQAKTIYVQMHALSRQIAQLVQILTKKPVCHADAPVRAPGAASCACFCPSAGLPGRGKMAA